MTMPPISVLGFIILRRPEFSGLRASGSQKGKPRDVDGVLYAGVERMPWEDLYEDFYARRLPEAVDKQFQIVRKQSENWFGAVSDFSSTVQLLSYANARSPQNEIVALRPEDPSFAEQYVATSVPMIYLGMDVMAIGAWSLINAGVFFRPDLFPGWRSRLNRHGLFESTTESETYAFDYIEASKRGEIEELPFENRVVSVAVYRP